MSSLNNTSPLLFGCDAGQSNITVGMVQGDEFRSATLSRGANVSQIFASGVAGEISIAKVYRAANLAFMSNAGGYIAKEARF